MIVLVVLAGMLTDDMILADETETLLTTSMSLQWLGCTNTLTPGLTLLVTKMGRGLRGTDGDGGGSQGDRRGEEGGG